MTEDRRVWLVVTGSYSDYQVECAAGSEADGEQIAATINAFGRSEYDPRCPVQEHRDMAARQHGGRP